MTDPVTTNKAFDLPANGEYPNTWDVPVNQNFTDIDSALGATTTVNVVAATGTVTLSRTQYLSPLLIFSGLLTANVNYQLPTGVGGFWYIVNSTTGAFTITLSSAGGGTTFVIPQGASLPVTSDGTNVRCAVVALPIAQGGTGSSSASGARTALGLGTSAVVDTGTSGTKVALLDGSNDWSTQQRIARTANSTNTVPLQVKNNGTQGVGSAVELQLLPNPNGATAAIRGTGLASTSAGVALSVMNAGVEADAISADNVATVRLNAYPAGTVSALSDGTLTTTSDETTKIDLGPFADTIVAPEPRPGETRAMAAFRAMGRARIFQRIEQQERIKDAVIALPALRDAADQAQKAFDGLPQDADPDHVAAARQGARTATRVLANAQDLADLAGDADTTTHPGWMAQAVQKVAPIGVKRSKEGLLSLDDRAVLALIYETLFDVLDELATQRA